MPRPSPRIGTFQISTVVATTRSAEVCRAALPGTDLPVAVHHMCRGIARDARARHAFLAEARILDRLCHPCIPHLLGQGVHDGRPWFATNLLAGPSLAELIAGGTRVDAASVVRDLAAILVHAGERGIALRNLTAEQVACVTDNGALVLAIRDWSDARELAGAPADAAASVYALGLIALQVLTGVMARATVAIASVARRRSVRTACPYAPAPMVALVERMLASAPWARPTLAEVHAEASRLVPGAARSDADLAADLDEVTRFDFALAG